MYFIPYHGINLIIFQLHNRMFLSHLLSLRSKGARSSGLCACVWVMQCSFRKYPCPFSDWGSDSVACRHWAIAGCKVYWETCFIILDGTKEVSDSCVSDHEGPRTHAHIQIPNLTPPHWHTHTWVWYLWNIHNRLYPPSSHRHRRNERFSLFLSLIWC